jgi:Integrase core domain
VIGANFEVLLKSTGPSAAFRKKIYRSITELQDDLDSWVQSYNEERPHQGRCFGKTPAQTFLDATPLAKEKMIATGPHLTYTPDRSQTPTVRSSTNCYTAKYGLGITLRDLLNTFSYAAKAGRRVLCSACAGSGRCRFTCRRAGSAGFCVVADQRLRGS